MTNNIGDITFGIGADIAGLQKAIQLTNKLGQATNAAARSTEEGAAKAVSALNRQEAAARKALAAVASFQNNARTLGADPTVIGQSTRAINSYLTTLSKGALDTVNMTRATDKFNATMGRVKSKIAGIDPPNSKLNKFHTILKDLESTSVLAVGPLSGVGSRIRALGAIFDRSTIAVGAMAAGMAGGSVGLYAISMAAARTGMQIDAMKSRFEAASGSQLAANREFDLAVGVVQKYGLSLNATLQDYSMFVAATKGSAIEGEKSRLVLEGMAVAARALQLNNEQVSGTLLAFTQMMSKGTVQAEELRGQVGERIPGAFRMAAEAMGVTEAKLGDMMKAGEVMASDLLPRLAQHMIDTFGAQAINNSDKLAANLARLDTNTTLFNQSFNQTFDITGKYNGAVKTANDLLIYFAQNMDNAKKVMGALMGATVGFMAVVAVSRWQTIAQGVMVLVGAIKGLRTMMITTGAVAAALTGPRGLLLLAGAAAAAAGAVAGFQAFDDAQEKVISSTQDNITATNEFIGAQSKAQTATKETTKIYLEEARKQAAVAQLQAAQLEEMYGFATVNGPVSGDSIGPGKRADEAKAKYAEAIKMKEAAFQRIQALDKLMGSAKSEGTGSGGVTGISDKEEAKIRKLNDALQPLESTLAHIRALKSGRNGVELFERAEKVREFAEALDKAGASQQMINEKTAEYANALRVYDDAQKRAAALDRVFDSNADALGSFVKGLRDSSKTVSDLWNDMVNNMLDSWMDFIWQTYVNQPLQNAFDSAGGFGGILDGILGGIFGGGDISSGSTYNPSSSAPPTKPALIGRASGGRVNAGQMYLTGEKGPEPFVPDGPGRILPTNALGSSVQINIINNSGSRVSTRERQTSNGTSLEVMIDNAVARSMSNPSSRSNKALRNVVNTGVAGR